MIPPEEIKEIAVRYGVPTSSVERDYAQGWLLASLSPRLGMAFKGGTCIRKMYLADYRFSDDLDFTLLEEYSEDQIHGRMVESVQEAKAESGIAFEDSLSLKKVTNGFRGTVGFKLLRTGGSPIKIKIDLTQLENEVMLIPAVRLPVIHPYSDGLDVEVLCYSLKEVLSEKVRSLFQRTRPRDLYDVWMLSKRGLDVTGILREKFESKDVTLDISYIVQRREDFENAWKNSLSHQISDLPDCGPVFDAVIGYLHSFEVLF